MRSRGALCLVCFGGPGLSQLSHKGTPVKGTLTAEVGGVGSDSFRGATGGVGAGTSSYLSATSLTAPFFAVVFFAKIN